MLKIKQFNSCLQPLLFAVLLIVLVSELSGANLLMDFCRFKGDQGRVYVEVYMDLPRSSVVYQRKAEGWIGALNFTSQILQDGKIIVRDKWTITDLVADYESIENNQRLIDVRIYNLTPGEYTFQIIVQDSLSETEWHAEPVIQVTAFPDSLLTISDLELASHFIPTNTHSKYSRGDFSLIPNPRRIFGNPQHLLWYYFELYPSADSAVIQNLEVSGWVLNGIRDTVIALPSVKRPDVRHSIAEWDSINVSQLASGSYILAVQVRDDQNLITSTQKKFYVYEPDLEPEAFKPLLDTLEINREITEIGFLMSRGQEYAVRNMTVEEKSQFLESFWRLYDDDPSDPFVPLRYMFRNRVAEADARWTNSRMDGHRTSRGRIYVLYGESDHLERHPLDLNSKPYEIWTYDKLDGGAFFVFVDRAGLGEYELVHSTRRGEISNLQWFELYVKRSGIDSRR